MASSSRIGCAETPELGETKVKAEVEAEQIVVLDDHVRVEGNAADVLPSHFESIRVTADSDCEDNDSDGDDGDDGDDDFFRAAIEAILPICGRCNAGPCRYGITESGEVYLKCCIKEGFGACGFFKWLDPQQIAESQKRIQEIAKKQG